MRFPVDLPSVQDLTNIQKQAGRLAGVLSMGRRCRHGIAQSVLLNPVRRDSKECDHLVHSALMYLICPRLTKKISAIEDKSDRGLQKYEKWLKDNPPLMKQMLAVHDDAPRLRRDVMGEEMWQDLTSLPPAHLAHLVLQTGRCGISRNKLEDASSSSGDSVKCLHYHLADLFVRHPPSLLSASSSDSRVSDETSPINVVGRKVFDDLVASGFEVDGTENCWKQCRGCSSDDPPTNDSSTMAKENRESEAG